MKLFNSVQELWSYCAFCPICQDICREPIVDLIIDIDNSFSFESKKRNQFLYLKYSGRLRGFSEKENFSHSSSFTIDCVKNTFEFWSVPDAPKESAFYIQSMCRDCGRTASYGSDLKLDMEKKIVTNIGLERENIDLIDGDDQISLLLDYEENAMYAAREKDIEGLIEDENHSDVKDISIKLPIVEMDFSKPKKAINKIKTLMLFS